MNKKYKITLHYEVEVFAQDEQDAIEFFWDREVYDTQQTEGDFIDNIMKIKEIKNVQTL